MFTHAPRPERTTPDAMAYIRQLEAANVRTYSAHDSVERKDIEHGANRSYLRHLWAQQQPCYEPGQKMPWERQQIGALSEFMARIQEIYILMDGNVLFLIKWPDSPYHLDTVEQPSSFPFCSIQKKIDHFFRIYGARPVRRSPLRANLIEHYGELKKLFFAQCYFLFFLFINQGMRQPGAHILTQTASTSFPKTKTTIQFTSVTLNQSS
jgi:hypothetical protein